MVKKVTFDDVMNQMEMCRMDCRRLIHSINEMRKKAFACYLLGVDSNDIFLDEALNDAVCALKHLDGFHLKNGVYVDDDDE